MKKMPANDAPKITIKPDIRPLRMSQIKPDPNNPRDISAEALQGLKTSLERFGYVDLLVVNKRNMQLVSGHQRYKVLTAQGVEEALCILVDVDEVQQKAMALSLNNQEIAGHWTAAIIPILEELRNQAPDDYINLRLRELREEVVEFERENMGAGKTLPDDIPPPPAKTITKAGDIWQLGPHRLMCGSSTSPDDVARLLGNEQPKLFASDPPYCVDYTGTARPNSKGSKKSHGGKDWSGVYHEIDIKDATAFYESYLRIGLKHCVKNVGVYMWHASRRYIEIAAVFEKLGLIIHQPIVWVKPCAIMTYSVYSWKHEPCIFGWMKGEKPHYRPAMKGIGTAWHLDLLRTGDPASPEYYSDIWELDWEGKKRPSAKDHPTVKPTEVFAIPMRIHTQPGDLCYEPFSGSGTQIIAAEKVNRRCYAMEIEPVFCDVAVKRWELYTGKTAELLKS